MRAELDELNMLVVALATPVDISDDATVIVLLLVALMGVVVSTVGNVSRPSVFDVDEFEVAKV